MCIRDRDIIYNKNIKEVTDATLINPENGPAALERIYEYYQRAESVVGDVLLEEDKQLGQKVQIDTGYDGIRTGVIAVSYTHLQLLRG